MVEWWTDAETTLTTGLYHLRHLSQSWWMIEVSWDFIGIQGGGRRENAIGKSMNMSLADINNMNLSEGTFRDVTGVELSRLVTAVYENSERRRGLLDLLANC